MVSGEEAASKPVRGRPFGKNDPRIAHNKRRLDAEATKNAPLVPVEGEGLLGAMRHVLANPKVHDVTEEQRQARAWLLDDRAGFFREKAKLEAAEMAARVGERETKSELEDVGASAALDLVADLLRKFKESDHGVRG